MCLVLWLAEARAEGCVGIEFGVRIWVDLFSLKFWVGARPVVGVWTRTRLCSEFVYIGPGLMGYSIG